MYHEFKAIFAAETVFSAARHKADKARELRARIQDAKTTVCGHCDFWMKIQCKVEHEHGRRRSCEDFGCKAFNRSNWSVSFIEELQASLVEAEKK